MEYRDHAGGTEAAEVEEAMKKNETVKACRKCGRLIGIIDRGLYRKVVVDASGFEIVPDDAGEEFIRIDGSKVRARVLERYDDDTAVCEYAYRPHRCQG